MLTDLEIISIDNIFEITTEFANKCNKTFSFEFRDVKCEAHPGGNPKTGVENYSRLKDNDLPDGTARN